MSALNIVDDRTNHPPHHLLGYYIEKPDGSRVGQTFSNCGTNDLGAMNNARLFAGAGDLLVAIKKAREAIAIDRNALFECSRNPASGRVEDADDRHAINELDQVLMAIDEAISNAEPL